MPDIRNEIIDNLQVRGSVSGGSLGSLARAVRVAMTEAASVGSAQVQDNDSLDMGTNNCSFRFNVALGDYTPSAYARLFSKSQDAGNLVDIGLVDPTGTIRIRATVAGVSIFSCTSTAAIGLTDSGAAEITVVLVRETASTAGSATFYVNGVQLGAAVAITAAATVSISNSGAAIFMGTATTRIANAFQELLIYNRALSAAEVLSLYNNGPALADLGASQTEQFTGDFSTADGFLNISGGSTVTANIDGVSDGTTSKDNCLRVDKTVTAASCGAVKTTGTLFTDFKNAWARASIYVPAGQTYIDGFIITRGSTISAETTIFDGTGRNGTWVDLSGIGKYVSTVGSNTRIYIWALDGSSSTISASAVGELFYITGISFGQAGVTGWWDARDAQSDTGQILDSSGNKNHAMLPASGATVIGKPLSEARQVRWTNTWTGTQELQYIGGVNQAVLPAKAYIESIVGIVSGATVEDIIIGDGSDTDRYVALTTALAAGTVTFTLANRTTDGTNLKLTVDPDANATMSIIWTVTYRILE